MQLNTSGMQPEAREIQIAVDGPAGAGKSTLGRGLAKAFNCVFLDTGLMYRAVAARALDSDIAPADSPRIADVARELQFAIDDSGSDALLIDGAAPSRRLTSPEIDAIVSEVSANPGVRSVMVSWQRALVAGRCVVMVGRDIGTVVLPDAPIKFWVTASPEVRAGRRSRDHTRESHNEGTRPIGHQLHERDAFDAGRSVSPLSRADDAIDLETDRLSVEEALRVAAEIVEQRLQSAGTASPRSAT